MAISDSVILGTARTPFGKLGGAISALDATDLGGCAIRAALDRSGVAADEVQHVTFGQVLQAGQGQIPSRQAHIKAGVPKDVSSETINKMCASGMRSLGVADTAIRCGDADVVVAGGMESMTNAPYLLPGARSGFRMGDAAVVDAMTFDGLTSPFSGKRMIGEASIVARNLDVPRSQMDRFAARSHRRAADATRSGRLAEEIAGVQGSLTTSDLVTTDEAIRPEATLEQLASLPAIDGDTHTAGNSPGVSDGACAIVVASTEWAARNGASPIARVLAFGRVAGPFTRLGYVPAEAAALALKKAGKNPADVDLWEINEAFASVVLSSIRVLGVDEAKVNVNGGAIAIGHPIGASGARIVGALIHELRRRGGGIGCAAICSAGVQGDAVVLEVD